MKRIYYFSALLGISLFYFFSYWPVYSFAYSLHTLISDTAIFGLMAEDILSGKNFPWYFYGQNYMGPFTSLFIALIQLVFNFFKLEQPIPFYGQFYVLSPLAIQSAGLLMVYFGNLFFTLGMRSFLGDLKSLILFLLLSASSTIICQAAIRPLGAEMAYFFAGVMVYFYYHFKKSDGEPLQRFSFGVLLALSLWGNQTVIFIWGAFFIYYFVHSSLYSFFSDGDFFKGRINFSRYHLNISSKVVLTFLQLIAFFIMAMGLTVSFFFGQLKIGKLNIPNGFSYFKSGFFLFFLLHFFLEQKNNPQFKNKITEGLKKIKYFIFGYLSGHAPLFFAGLLAFYEKSYSVKFKFIKLADYPEYLYKFFTHFLNNLMIGQFDNWMWPFSLFILGLLFLILKIERQNSGGFKQSKLFIPQVAILLNLIYLLTSERSREQYVVRYGILILPFFYALLIYGLSLGKSFLKWGVSFVLLCLFYFANIQRHSILQEIGNSKAAYLDQIRLFSEKSYSSCFAEHNDAYRLELLTGRNVLFVPIDSQDRTPSRSKKLAPLTKCVYANGALSEK